MEIVTLKEARERGLTRYFTGQPCKRNHLAERGTASRACVECASSWEKNWRATDPSAARAKDKKRREPKMSERREHSKKYRIKNGDRLRDKERRIYAENPEKFRSKTQRYVEKNKAIVIAKSRQRYAANPKAAIETVRRWQKSNPEATRIMWSNRSARKRNAVGTHTKDDVADILQKQRGKCGYCKRKVNDDYHVDHIVALAMGGSNDRRNLQILCPPCNMKKGAKHPIVFSQSIGLLL